MRANKVAQSALNLVDVEKKKIVREIVCLNRALKQWPGACCNFIFRSRSVQLPLNYPHLFLLLLLLVQLKYRHIEYIYMCIWVKRANNRSVISRCTQMVRKKKKNWVLHEVCNMHMGYYFCVCVLVCARWLFHSAHPYLQYEAIEPALCIHRKTNFYIHSCDLVLF